MQNQILDHSYGFASIVDGHIPYSPSSQRHIIVPSRPSQGQNILLPTKTSSTGSGYYDLSKLHLKTHQELQWWTPQFEWAVFIPRKPLFSSLIFRRLSFDAYTKHLVGNNNNGYPIHEKLLFEWNCLETDIYRAIYRILSLSGANTVKPFLPWIFGYKKVHKSIKNALFSFRRLRDWFVVWMGLLSYAVASCKTAEAARRP